MTMVRYVSLTMENYREYWQGYCDTVSDISPPGKHTEKSFGQSLEKVLKQGTSIMIALDKNNDVIGTCSIFIEHKLTRGGCTAGHLEELSVKEKRRDSSVGGELIKQVIAIAKQHNCYRITGDSTPEVTRNYEAFGLKGTEIGFKMYFD